MKRKPASTASSSTWRYGVAYIIRVGRWLPNSCLALLHVGVALRGTKKRSVCQHFYVIHHAWRFVFVIIAQKVPLAADHDGFIPLPLTPHTQSPSLMCSPYIHISGPFSSHLLLFRRTLEVYFASTALAKAANQTATACAPASRDPKQTSPLT